MLNQDIIEETKKAIIRTDEVGGFLVKIPEEHFSSELESFLFNYDIIIEKNLKQNYFCVKWTPKGLRSNRHLFNLSNRERIISEIRKSNAINKKFNVSVFTDWLLKKSKQSITIEDLKDLTEQYLKEELIDK